MKRPLPDMLPVAERIAARLAPHCLRIEIAGSIRRQCPIIGDIEIVAIPRPVYGMFNIPTGKTEIGDRLEWDNIPMTKNGPRYKQFTIEDEGNEYQVDLFLANEDNWGLILLLRTGPAEFSKRMETSVEVGGLMPERFIVAGGAVWEKQMHRGTPIETIIGTEEEVEMFRLWEMDYIEPKDRR